MKILVTGASGFIGHHLSAELLSRGHHVRNAVRQARTAGPVDGMDECVVGDIDHATQWAAAVDGIDAVVHLAGRAHVLQRSAARAIEDFRPVNVAGSAALLKAAQAAGVKRFVNVSSIGVLGVSTGKHAFTERTPAAPTNPYAQSKFEAEQLLSKLAETIELIHVRPPLVYGPRGRGNLLRLLRLANSGVPLPLASARGERDMIGVDNLTDILALCAERPGLAGTFVVRDGEPITTADLTAMLRRKLGLKPRLVPVPSWVLAGAAAMMGRAEEVQRLFEPLLIDDQLFRTTARWAPRVSLSVGLDRLIDWYKRGCP